jgi:hypothetical protein
MTTYKVISQADTNRVEVKKVEYKVSLSRTGGQGASNNGTILGGLAVLLNNVEEGDVLTIEGNQWVNTRRTNLTDGGNF